MSSSTEASDKPQSVSRENSPKASPQAWDDELLQSPHTVADKRAHVQKMFAAIAPSYDLNNRLHSLWMDQAWRRKAVKLAGVRHIEERVVDVACGTGDLTLEFLKRFYDLWCASKGTIADGLPDLRVIGIDFTYQMLPIATHKSHHAMERMGNRVAVGYLTGDAQSLPLPDASADVVSIAFGIRNVQDPAAAVREFHRVLRPGGRVIVLEFSLPTNLVLRGLYNVYFRQILPRTATLISGDKTGAYKYLPESVNTFISRKSMMNMLRDAGFTQVQQFPMTFGVCICYRGLKT